MRSKGFHLKHGFAVLAIPDSGLFTKAGQIVTGHETELRFSELILFSRRQDAEDHASKSKTYWEDGDANGHRWSFQVIPVVVSERL
jgi:hypothetical protein